jgi:plasmid stability protein
MTASWEQEAKMAQILVRDIEDDVKERLQRRASRHGQSMEAEVRDILRHSVEDEDIASGGLGSDMVALFEGIASQIQVMFRQLRRETLARCCHTMS